MLVQFRFPTRLFKFKCKKKRNNFARGYEHRACIYCKKKKNIYIKRDNFVGVCSHRHYTSFLLRALRVTPSYTLPELQIQRAEFQSSKHNTLAPSELRRRVLTRAKVIAQKMRVLHRWHDMAENTVLFIAMVFRRHI